MTLRWEGAYGKAFRVQGSTNGTTWTTLSTITNGTGGTQSIALDGTARYVRLDLQTRATGYGFSLWEVAVRTTGGGTTTPTPDPSGPADGKVRIAGSQGNRCLSRQPAIGRNRRSLSIPSSIWATIKQISSLSVISRGRPRRRIGSRGVGKSEQAAQ